MADVTAPDSGEAQQVVDEEDDKGLFGGDIPPCAEGESVIKYKSPLNVLKDTHDYSCY